MSAKVTLGADGLIEGVKPGTVIVDCSTVAPAYARRAANTLQEKAINFLDAPGHRLQARAPKAGPSPSWSAATRRSMKK